MGLVPEADVAHTGVSNGNAVAIAFCLQSNLSGDITQNDSVVIKQGMLQRNNLVVLQGERSSFAGEEIPRGYQIHFRLAFFAEAELIVLKLLARNQGHIEAGVSANAEGQLLIIQVFYLIEGVQGVAPQGIDDGKGELSGVYGQSRFAAAKPHFQIGRLVLDYLKIAQPGKAVAAQLVPVAV